jgi:hypothetical protein
MSFMIVCGKLFVCNKCEKVVRVEYEGGAQFTQIGDLNVMEQEHFSEALGQLNNEPDEQGYYLYDFGLCDKCFDTKINRDYKRKSEAIFRISDELAVKRQENLDDINGYLPDLFSRAASGLSSEDIGSAIGQQFDPAFGDKHATATKRDRLLNDFMHKHRNALVEYCVRKVWTDPRIISAIVTRYAETTQPMLTELKTLVADPPPMYFEKTTDKTENLNDWIIAETTSRQPALYSSRETFYSDMEIDFDVLLLSFDFNHESLYEEVFSKDNTRLLRSRLVELIEV